MKFAYADPPYPGQAAKLYRNHPDYAGEVDHAALLHRLFRDYPDGWALSTSSRALPQVLSLCPATVRVAAWHVQNRNLRGSYRWMLCWEPVIVYGGRQLHGEAPAVRDLLASGQAGRQGRFPGGKPPVFCRWVFTLLGALPGDELDDLFPGSGAVGKAWREYASQPWIEPTERRYDRQRRDRRVTEHHDPLMGKIDE